MDRFGQFLIFFVLIFSVESDDASEQSKTMENNIRAYGESNSQDNDKMADYPHEKVEAYLEAKPHLKTFLSTPVSDTEFRAGDYLSDYTDLCRAKKETYFTPYFLKNTGGVSRTIVNTGKWRQYVTRETCLSNADLFCNQSAILGYTTKCSQNYATRRLLVFDATKPDDEIYDYFPIPSCCVCKILKAA